MLHACKNNGTRSRFSHVLGATPAEKTAKAKALAKAKAEAKPKVKAKAQPAALALRLSPLAPLFGGRQIHVTMRNRIARRSTAMQIQIVPPMMRQSDRVLFQSSRPTKSHKERGESIGKPKNQST